MEINYPKINWIILGNLWVSLLWAATPQEPISPLLELKTPATAQEVALGKKLFNDKRLSFNQSISCANCHQLQHGGAEHKALSVGAKGLTTQVNTPSIFNLAYKYRYFWNGRTRSLEEAIEQNILDPKIMNENWSSVVKKLNEVNEYKTEFNKIFGDKIKPKYIKNSLANYIRTLTTPNSRFDQYLQGKPDSLTDKELKGYALFKDYGCIACHQGKNIGSNIFQKMGIYHTYPGQKQDQYLGLYAITQNKQDQYVFRVPSLRNVALTPPYFHDGSAADLTQAVQLMSYHQLGQSMPKKDVALIVKFLETLTGNIPSE